MSLPDDIDAVVLDGNQRAALAIVRTLGAKGFRILVGDERQNTLAARSRYAAASFVHSQPNQGSRAFLDDLVDGARGSAKPVLFPVTDITVSLVLKDRVFLDDHFRIPFSSFDGYDRLSDKKGLFEMACRLGVPMPATVFPRLMAEDRPMLGTRDSRSLGFPLVVKPARSRVHGKDGWTATSVHYAEDEAELGRILGNEPFLSYPFVLQERIEGPGVGIFLLMKEGDVLARFAHRRIREKPPSGGVSVLCESIEPPADALDSATRLLSELNWTGVAMVEFKRDRRDGVHKLIEVNARFWGSLQLAVSAGVDFPYLLYRMALGETVRGPDRYRVGLKSRWELGDLDHLLIRLGKKASELHLPGGAPSCGALLISFLSDFLAPSVRGEVLRPGDPGPFLFELKEYLRRLAWRS